MEQTTYHANAVTIVACDPAHPDACGLIAELSSTLATLTGDSGCAHFSVTDTRTARALFVLACSADGTPLGCGALRPLHDTVAEAKRMYARPGTRGVGAALLAHLESAAVAFGYSALWLETRRVNTRAVNFYLRHGYREIPQYGPYVGRTDALCLGKYLDHHATV